MEGPQISMNLGYGDFKVATRELETELFTKGERVANTVELLNVAYSVSDPHLEDLKPHQLWADVEFGERAGLDHPVNPGNSWKELPEVWEPMKEKSGLYSYTYSERMFYQLPEVIHELNSNPSSREAYISIWSHSIDPFRLGRRRVPCTLGYQFFIRDGKLNMTYLQRSCNFSKHFQDDVYLARKLQEWVAGKLKITPGTFSHWIGSLHIFT